MGKKPRNPYYSIKGRRGGRRVVELYGLEHFRRMGRISQAARAAKPKPEPRPSELVVVFARLRHDQAKRLGQVAKATKTPKAELIRQAVDMWLDEWTKRHANKISKKRVRPLAVDPKEAEQEGKP